MRIRIPRVQPRLLVPIGAIGAVVAASIARLARFGFMNVAPDEGSYLGAGLDLLALEAPRDPSGNVFTIRGWAYPTILALSSKLGGSDVFRGPEYLVWTLATLGLALAVYVAWRIGGGPASVATAVALLATPMLWTTFRSLRIDIVLVTFTLVFLLIVARPTPGRALAGGIWMGITLLTKETAAPLALAPLVWLGAVPTAAWWRLVVRFGIGFVATTFWWFVLVLIARGELFGVQAASLTVRSDIERSFVLNTSAKVLVAAFVLGWLGVAVLHHREIFGRLLLLGGLAFVPAAVVAWDQEFALRQFTPIVVLSCIALGVTIGDLLVHGFRILTRVLESRTATLTSAVVATLLVAVGLVPALRIERTLTPASPSWLDEPVAEWLDPRFTSDDERIVSTRGGALHLAARVRRHAEVLPLEIHESTTLPPFEEMAWIGVGGRGYEFVRRDQLQGQLADADVLVLTGQNQLLGPRTLGAFLLAHGDRFGFGEGEQFAHTEPIAIYAFAFLLDDPDLSELPTVVSPSIANALAADGQTTTGAGLVIVGTAADVEALDAQGAFPDAGRVVVS